MVFATAAILALVGIGAILLYMFFALNETHIFLKFIFFFTSFILFIIAINFVRMIVPSVYIVNFDVAFYILIMTIFISFIYFIIYYIKDSLKIKDASRRKEQGLD